MASPAGEHVSINGAQLRVRLEGPEGAPTVVLAHSLGTDMRVWDLQVPALTPRYQVLRYDARGHGQSDPPIGSVSIDLLADDLIGLIEFFEIEQAHVIGVSMGAVTAMAVGLRGVPRVASIAFCDSRVDVSPEFARAVDERNQFVHANGLQAIADTQPQRWLSPKGASERPDLVEKIRAMFLTTSLEGFTACAEAVKNNDLFDKVEQIAKPALFVAADLDAGLPVEVIRNLHQRVAGSRFAVIEGAGHLANLEQPEQFNAALLDFLDGLFPRQR